MKRVVILSSAESPANRKILSDFTRQLQQRIGDDITVTSFHYRDIGWTVGAEAKITHLPSGLVISDVDFVWFKSYVRYEEEAVAIAHLLNQLDINFVSSELLSSASTSKLTQYVRLWAAGLPMPRTAYVPLSYLRQEFESIQNSFGKKIIIKAADGKGGDDNYCIDSLPQADEIASKHKDQNFVIQEFIPNDADYRVLVVGDEPKMIIERRRQDDTTHLNNTSQGAQAQLLPLDALSKAEIALCLDAAQTLKREVAGVDLMRDSQTAKPYILEVNSGPQVGSGAFTSEKLAMFADYLKRV